MPTKNAPPISERQELMLHFTWYPDSSLAENDDSPRRFASDWLQGKLWQSTKGNDQWEKTTFVMLLTRIHVKPGCHDQYVELARITDSAVQASESGTLHHRLDQDPDHR